MPMPSVYIHVPFCWKKCSYCAFYSVPLIVEGRRNNRHLAAGSDLVDNYLKGVRREVKLRSKEAPAGVSSLFIGGGTPTVLEPRQLDELLGEVHKHYQFQPAGESSLSPGTEDSPPGAVEKTVEANPGTLTPEKLAVLTNYGINRISLGAQCFNNNILRTIGRIHTGEEIFAAVEAVRKAGIANLNLDLIFGLPGQTLAAWQDTLQLALQCSPEHLSLYALTLEEKTPLGQKYLRQAPEEKAPQGVFHGEKALVREALFLPDDDLQADMYEWSVDYLAGNGYIRYEISNFARPGYECSHNLAYWRGEEYIGLGPGAVSCVRGTRARNIEDINAYAKILAAGYQPWDQEETEYLTPGQQRSEYIMLGLRTAEGVDCRAFFEKFKISIQDIYGPIMAKYIDRGMLSLNNDRLRINPFYFFVANAILVDFME